MKRISSVVLCAFLILVSAPLYAQGILLVQSETSGGKTTTNQIQMDKNNMRMETGGGQTVTMFDGAKQVLRMLNTSTKTYQEITKAELDSIKQQMDTMMAQLQNISPAQRQQMEQLMQGRGMPGMPGMPAAATPPKIEYRAAGSDKVGQWACTKYEGYLEQKKTVEVCAANPSVFNLATADLDVGKQMREFLKSIAPSSVDNVMLNGTVQEQGFPGMAIRRTTFVNGAVSSVMEIKELRRETFPASTFAVPAGFIKQASPLGRGAR